MRFLSNTFNKAESGLRIILAMLALLVRREVTPHVCLFLIGPGGEGKTMFTSKLFGSVLGSGHANASSHLLQQENEFKKQGHLFLTKAWLAFDEMKPFAGIQEEIFKMLVSGGFLDLRRNHEAETHYARWHRACESWNGNERDIPFISSAKEHTFKRRIRGVRLSSQFTTDPTKVDHSAGVYPADPDLGEWLSSLTAGLVF